MFLERTGAEIGNYLSYLSKRQEAIASNIANADTPGYKTRDVDQPGGFAGLMGELTQGFVETPGLTAKNDGNNVSIDREARLLAETTMKFNLATQMLRGQLHDIKSAIEEGRSS